MDTHNSRVVFSGLVAGVAINTAEYALHDLVFDQRWAAAIKAINDSMKPAGTWTPLELMAPFQVFGFLAGLLAMRLYAALRRPGRNRTVWPALLAWLLLYVPAGAALWLLQGLPQPLIEIFAAGGLFGTMLGTSLGSWVYRESEGAAERLTPVA